MRNNKFKVREHFANEDFQILLNEYILAHLKKISREKRIGSNNNGTNTNCLNEVID
jgi:hypothetical protein